MKKSISLFVFIDALGWEILKESTFLDDVLVQKAPIGTIFGYSATCDPTILTGLLPRDHDHFSFYAYDPEHSPFRNDLFIQLMRLVPKALSSRNRVRNVAGRIIKRKLAYTGYFNIYNMPFRLMRFFDYTEKKDLYQPGGINSGAATIMDYLRDQQIPFYLSDWRASEQNNLSSLKQALTDSGTDLAYGYLYLAAMDATLHAQGFPHQEVTDKIAWYENELREVLEVAQAEYEDVRMFIFSDHGMTNITGTFDLRSLIEKTSLVFGKDYAAVYDSTMARFWFLNDTAEEPIREVLQQVSCGTILSQQTLHSWGADFANNRYGDLIFLLDPGVLLIPSHMGERPLAGMHGYDPHDKDSVASFSTNTHLQNLPERLDDLYGLMKEEADRNAALNSGRE
ncbi:MAG: alkaline phosphatase family protein [Spirochaetia bacterium]|nr:alkaline phosphatase family protein [Spirochaetia bacterium]